MFTNERRQKILEMLEKKHSVTVEELVTCFDVSAATIRSDLNKLAETDLLIRTHGGATKNDEKAITEAERAYDIRKSVNLAEKQVIAKKAIRYIHANDCILLDASSTCYELAQLLLEYTEPLTVLTSGLRTASLLKENGQLTVIILGGIVTPNSNAIEGSLGIDLLKKFNIDTFFTSSYAISAKDGLSDFKMYEAELKKLMIKESEQTIALIDSTKFEKKSIINFATLQEIQLIISDGKLPNETTSIYENISIV